MNWWVIGVIALLFFNSPWGIRLIVLAVCIPYEFFVDGYPDTARGYWNYFLYGNREA